jgi:hypothetical protein
VLTSDMPIVATVGVAVAMLATAIGRPGDAAEMLGASARLRGAEDVTAPDVIAVRAAAAAGLGAAAAERHYDRGRGLDRAAAIARIDPARLR